MLFIILKLPIIDISIRISVFALSFTNLTYQKNYTIDIGALVLFTIRVHSSPLASIILGAVGRLPALRCELIWLLLLGLLIHVFECL